MAFQAPHVVIIAKRLLPRLDFRQWADKLPSNLLLNTGAVRRLADYRGIQNSAPPAGLEPATFFLTGSRSTIELQGNVKEQNDYIMILVL